MAERRGACFFSSSFFSVRCIRKSAERATGRSVYSCPCFLSFSTAATRHRAAFVWRESLCPGEEKRRSFTHLQQGRSFSGQTERGKAHALIVRPGLEFRAGVFHARLTRFSRGAAPLSAIWRACRPLPTKLDRSGAARRQCCEETRNLRVGRFIRLPLFFVRCVNYDSGPGNCCVRKSVSLYKKKFF